MRIKQVDEPPRDGTQFVAMWVFEGNLWSESCRYNARGYLEVYDHEIDDFSSAISIADHLEINYYINGTEEEE